MLFSCIVSSVIVGYCQPTTPSLTKLEELSSEIERRQSFKIAVLRRLDDTTALQQVRNSTAEILLWLEKSLNILFYWAVSSPQMFSPNTSWTESAWVKVQHVKNRLINLNLHMHIGRLEVHVTVESIVITLLKLCIAITLSYSFIRLFMGSTRQNNRDQLVG